MMTLGVWGKSDLSPLVEGPVLPTAVYLRSQPPDCNGTASDGDVRSSNRRNLVLATRPGMRKRERLGKAQGTLVPPITFRYSPTPRISPLAEPYLRPRPSLLIITCLRETNRSGSRSSSIIPCATVRAT